MPSARRVERENTFSRSSLVFFWCPNVYFFNVKLIRLLSSPNLTKPPVLSETPELVSRNRTIQEAGLEANLEPGLAAS